MNLIDNIPTIIFICYAIFINVYAITENWYYYIWLVAATCLFIGSYLISGVNNINYLYIVLTILYTLFLISTVLKYTYLTIYPSIYVLFLSIVVMTLLFKYKDDIVPTLKKFMSKLNIGTGTGPKITWVNIDLMFILCILVTTIILSFYYKFQYIFTSILFLTLFLVIIRYINKSDTTATTNNIFFTYNSLYLFIFLGIITFIYRLQHSHIPQVNNLLIYSTICSIVFGLKHFIFNNIVPPHIFLYFIIFIVIGFIYLSFATSFIPYSNKNIVLYCLFAILCILSSVLFGSLSTYLPFGVFIISIIVTIMFIISKYSINLYTVIYLSIFALLYSIVHGLNQLEYGNNQHEHATWVYLIICAMLFYLYFFISHPLSNMDRIQSYSVGTFILSLICYIGLSYFALSIFPEHKYSWLLFWVFITILLSMYYGFNRLIYGKDDIIIFLCIFYYFLGLIPFILTNKLPVFGIAFVFIILMTILFFIKHFWNKFSNTKEYDIHTNIYYLTLILLGCFFIIAVYLVYSKSPTIDTFKSGFSSMFYWVTLLFLFSMFIYYIYSVFTKGSINQKIYSIILIFIIAYIILKLFKGTMGHNPNSISGLIFNIVDYIPCLYDQTISTLIQIPSAVRTSTADPINLISLYIVVFIVVCILLYKYGYQYVYKYLQNKLYTSGHTIIDDPIPLDQTTVVMSYDELQELKFNPYQFGISFKLYINPIPATNTDFTLLTFSKYIYIQYNSYLNHITLWRLPDDLTEPVLIYRQTNVPLQTWVSYEVNFINNTCDVFVNDTLATSTNNITLYNNNDTTDVVVGTYNDGVSLIPGNIKNLILYNYPLNMFQISMIK